MLPVIFVRKAVEADIARLQEIRAAVRENQLSDPSKITVNDYRWFIANGPTWVYEEKGIVKGFAAGDPRNGTIWALFVDPVYEGQGVGRAIFAAVCQSLAEAGHAQASLSTDTGTRAEKFYRASGWQENGTNAHGEIFFRKALKSSPS